MATNRSRLWITIGVLVLLLSAIAWAFWPRPLLVDIGDVRRGEMTVTINDEGRTKVRDTYVISSPVAGRLLRIDVEAGDIIHEGKTLLARMLPANPPALDARSREQARAAVSAAEASVRVTRAELNKALADSALRSAELERIRSLRKTGSVSVAALETAEREWRSANASLDMAEASISKSQADLASARAQLISFNSVQVTPFVNGKTVKDELIKGESSDLIRIFAPSSGRVLRVLQESEVTLPAGQALLEIGDISNDLEIVTELLSTDAVRVSPGNRVVIHNWGGSKPLHGHVEKVEPWGFTKFSALGVEEQRVNATIQFAELVDGQGELKDKLGHGFRVETRIVVWEKPNVLIVPASALFRRGNDWVVFAVLQGRAVLKEVEIGQHNGVSAEVIAGLEEGAQVVLYPATEIYEGAFVANRDLK